MREADYNQGSKISCRFGLNVRKKQIGRLPLGEIVENFFKFLDDILLRFACRAKEEGF
jgi:hypothetical protein